MASLAGIPPFLGFWTKLAVLGAAINGDLLWLAMVGVICAVIGCFYYLRVIKVMYFDEPVGEALPRNNDRILGIVLGVNSVLLLFLPLGLGPILQWMRTAFAHLS
jgi:NADH-quinone oxidoreductase subunit N